MRILFLVFLSLPFLTLSCKQAQPTALPSEEASAEALLLNTENAGQHSPQQELKYEFLSVYDILQKHHLWQNNLEKIENYTDIQSIFSKLNDRFSGYTAPKLSESKLDQFKTPKVQEGRMGFLFDTIPSGDTLAITFVYRDSPAEAIELKVGDQLLHWVSPKNDSISLIGISKDSLNALTKGPNGTSVRLHIKRGDSLWLASLAKGVVTDPTVAWSSLKNDVSYIRVLSFRTTNSENSKWRTSNEFLYALEQTSNSKKTIVDLRNNLGGEVGQCTRLADFFVAGSKIIYKTKSRLDFEVDLKEKETTQFATDSLLSLGREYVFLANEWSASCAEIFLFAIQNNTAWPIVGTKSYGKGIGQALYSTYLKGLVKTTTLQFFDHNDKSYHGIGIIPTFVVEGEDAQMEKAIGILLPRASRGFYKQSSSYITFDRLLPTLENPYPFPGAWILTI